MKCCLLLGGLAVAVLCCNTASAQVSAYAEATAFVRQGHHQQAIPLIEDLVRREPDNLRARNLLGIALMGVGRRADASALFEQALKLDPNFLPALKNLAHNELELGLIQKAGEHFNAALRSNPEDASVHFGLGHVAFLRGSYAIAVKHYENSDGLHLREPLGQVRYAASCAAIGLRDEALHALRAFPREAPAPLHFQAGIVQAQLENFDEAVQRFEMAHSAGMDAPEVAYNLALAHLKKGSPDQAIRVVERALEQGRPSVELYSLLAQGYERSGQTKEAYEALRKAIRVSPHEEGPYVELIALCLGHENQELGLEIADIGVKQIPSSSRLHLQRGVLYALESRADEALADFRAAVKLDPEAPLGYVAQALQLLRMDQNADAVRLLRTRTKTAPSDALANWMLADALTKLGSDGGEEEAVEALERSVQSNGRLPQARILLGKLMLSRGDNARAQAELEKALELEPASVAAAYLLGQVYRKQGKAAEATRLFAKVGDAGADGGEQAENKALLRIVRENLPNSRQ